MKDGHAPHQQAAADIARWLTTRQNRPWPWPWHGVAVARAAERRGFLLLALGYPVAGSPLGFTARTRFPRAPPSPFTSGTGRAESPSEQNKGVCKTPLPMGETGERRGGRGPPEPRRSGRGWKSPPGEKR